MTESIGSLVTADDENVKFVEEETRKVRGKNVTTKVIQALPVQMGEILHHEIWKDTRPCPQLQRHRHRGQRLRSASAARV